MKRRRHSLPAPAEAKHRSIFISGYHGPDDSMWHQRRVCIGCGFFHWRSETLEEARQRAVAEVRSANAGGHPKPYGAVFDGPCELTFPIPPPLNQGAA